MNHLIPCDFCHANGNFPIRLNFTPERKHCPSCRNCKDTSWTYFFCNLKCFTEWMEKHKVIGDGFPCKSCQGTGYAFGFYENGLCPFCDGSTKVTDTREKIQ